MLPLYFTENETFVEPAGTWIRPCGRISQEEEQLFEWSNANEVLEGTSIFMKVYIESPIDFTVIYSKVIK